ncbi:MAG: tetratricopeptide repeat protein [Acidobacteriaceae bacterium]
MSATAPGRRIDSWKEIAAFFGRDERTVRRWEKERSLPVHRIPGERGGVFAYTGELTRWLNSTSEAGEQGIPAGAAAPQPAPTEHAPTASAAEAPPSLSRPRAGRFWPVPLALSVAALVLLTYAGYRRHANAHRPRPAVPAASASAHIPDPEAEEFYLKGRYDWDRRTEGSLNLAVDAFTQAVVHDPGYAQAYAGLAECYDIMPEFTSMPRSEAFPRAIAAASKALALDDSLSEAHRALAFALFYWEWNFPRALAEYRRAIAIDPRDEEAHHWYATSLMTLHRYPEALAEINQARKLEPTSRSILSDQALIRYWSGDHAGAIARLREIERAEPDFLSAPRYLAGLAFTQRDYRTFIDQTRRIGTITHDPQYTDLAAAAERGLSRGGTRGMLEAMRPVQEHYFQTGRTSGYELARTCALLGRQDDAVRYLKATIQARDYIVFGSISDPDFASLRGNAGFEQIRRQLLGHIGAQG